VPRATSPRTDRLGNPYDEQHNPDTSKALVMQPGMKRMSIRDLPAKVMQEASAIFDGTHAILSEEMGSNPMALATRDREPLGTSIQNLPPQIYDYEFWEEPGQLDQYNTFLKQHLKVYRELFSRYSSLTGNAKAGGNAIIRPGATFEDAAKSNNTITLISLTKLLKDYGVDNKRTAKALKDNVLILMKVINRHYRGQKGGGDISNITFEAF